MFRVSPLVGENGPDNRHSRFDWKSVFSFSWSFGPPWGAPRPRSIMHRGCIPQDTSFCFALRFLFSGRPILKDSSICAPPVIFGSLVLLDTLKEGLNEMMSPSFM